MLQIRMKIYSRIPQMGSNSFYFFPHQPLSLLPHSKIICSLTSLSLCINMFPFLCLGNSLFIHSSDSYPFLLCLLKFYLLWEDSPGWHGVFIYFFCPHLNAGNKNASHHGKYCIYFTEDNFPGSKQNCEPLG